MAIVKIQNRRGIYSNFDPSKLLPGEFAVVQSGDPNVSDGKALYLCISSGNVRRIATIEEMQAAIETIVNESISEVTDKVDEYLEDIENKGEEVLESIPSDYSTLSSDVDDLKADLYDKTELTFVSGKYINTGGTGVNIGSTIDVSNPSTYATLKYAIANCEEDDEFYLNGITGAVSGRAWAFLTSSNVLISRSDASVSVTGYIKAPANAGKVVINDNFQSGTSGGKAYKVSQNSVLDNMVRFDKAQNLTDTQKTQAKTNIGVIEGLSNDAKIALLNCFKHVYWMDHNADYYGTLYVALYGEQPIPLYNWDFTKSLTDTINGQVAILKKNNSGTLPTRDTSGVHFDAYGQSIQLFGDTATLEQTLKNKTLQVDVASFTPGNTSYHTRFIMFSKSKADIDNQVFNVGIIYRNNGASSQWSMYTCDPSAVSGSWASGFGVTNRDAISGHTVSVYIGNDYKAKLYIDNQSYGTSDIAFYSNMVSLFIGSNDSASAGATFYNALVTGVRIYEGDVCNGV